MHQINPDSLLRDLLKNDLIKMGYASEYIEVAMRKEIEKDRIIKLSILDLLYRIEEMQSNKEFYEKNYKGQTDFKKIKIDLNDRYKMVLLKYLILFT